MWQGLRFHQCKRDCDTPLIFPLFFTEMENGLHDIYIYQLSLLFILVSIYTCVFPILTYKNRRCIDSFLNPEFVKFKICHILNGHLWQVCSYKLCLYTYVQIYHILFIFGYKNSIRKVFQSPLFIFVIKMLVSLYKYCIMYCVYSITVI